MVAIGASVAHARSSVIVSWPYDDVWPAGLRFLKLDEKLAITERDAEAGYVLFELSEEKKKFKGRFELVRTKDGKGRPSTRVVVSLEGRPDYAEQGLLDRFERRLREDLGKPTDPPPPAPPPDKNDQKKKDEPKDGGKDGDRPRDPRDDGPPITGDLVTDQP